MNYGYAVPFQIKYYRGSLSWSRLQSGSKNGHDVHSNGNHRLLTPQIYKENNSVSSYLNQTAVSLRCHQGHVAQRSRWGIGLCQMILALKYSPNNAIARDLRWGIAKQGTIILLTLANRVFMQLVVPLAFFSGQMLVPASSSTHVKVQGVLAIVSLGLTWLFEWSLTAKSGYGGPPFGDLEEIWLAHSKFPKLL